MAITRERATRTESGGYIDRLGYAICIDCHGETREGAKWFPTCNIDGGKCDRCEKPFEDCTPMEIEGEAMIEHVAVKIF